VVKVLLQFGADIDAKNTTYKTPLMYAKRILTPSIHAERANISISDLTDLLYPFRKDEVLTASDGPALNDCRRLID
jgi:ankyrin repeat protein